MLKKVDRKAAIQAAEELKRRCEGQADGLYNTACVYCFIAEATEEEGERKKFLDEAMTTLQEAVKAGFDDFDKISHESQFHSSTIFHFALIATSLDCWSQSEVNGSQCRCSLRERCAKLGTLAQFGSWASGSFGFTSVATGFQPVD
jgi:hypothetical protein